MAVEIKNELLPEPMQRQRSSRFKIETTEIENNKDSKCGCN